MFYGASHPSSLRALSRRRSQKAEGKRRARALGLVTRQAESQEIVLSRTTTIGAFPATNPQLSDQAAVEDRRVLGQHEGAALRLASTAAGAPDGGTLSHGLIRPQHGGGGRGTGGRVETLVARGQLDRHRWPRGPARGDGPDSPPPQARSRDHPAKRAGGPRAIRDATVGAGPRPVRRFLPGRFGRGRRRHRGPEARCRLTVFLSA